jgi:undecaprenyl-diphosphatase
MDRPRLTRLERALEKFARFVSFILAGAAVLLLWFVSELSGELFEPDPAPNLVVRIDRSILVAVSHWRRPWLNPMAVDFTALGGPTLLTLFTLLVLAVALVHGQRHTARHLLVASIGAALLNIGLKQFWTRPRPTEVSRLVQTAGYSFPSGHSMGSAAMLTTFAILSWQYVSSPAQRVAIMIVAGLLIALIGTSRVYLGVHYPSDVAAGIALGVAWAFTLELAERHLSRRRRAARRHLRIDAASDQV